MSQLRREGVPVIDIPPNPARGRDLVFGDIHGCFGTVEHALERLGYDASRDRLFSLGDLIDYGTRSREALDWIGSKFTATVRGNHEQMMIEWLWDGSMTASEAKIWREHWTSWWFRSSEPAEVRWRWFDALQRLPFAATVHTAGGTRIGLVHGYPSLRDDMRTWDGLCAALENEGARGTSSAVGPIARSAMWDRPPTYADRGVSGLQNIELVLHGHDPAPEPRWTAERTLCIDTAVQWPDYGRLTVAEIHRGAPILHRFARVENDTVLEAPPRAAGLWDHGQGLNREAYVDAMGTTEPPTPLSIEYQARRISNRNHER